MEYANDIAGVITEFPELPSYWNGIDGFNYSDVPTQQANGFYELVTPLYDPLTQYLDGIYFQSQNLIYTYNVVQKTEEQIQAEKELANVIEKEALTDEILAADVVITAQLETDPQKQLDQQVLYPFWAENAVPYTVEQKVQAFDATEIKLYRCEQSHISQAGWQPPITPALWTRVAAAGEVLAWVQPTGAQDAYQIGNRVHFPTLADAIYVSDVADNVWSPVDYGWSLDSENPIEN